MEVVSNSKSIHLPIDKSFMPLIPIDFKALLTVKPSGSKIPSL